MKKKIKDLNIDQILILCRTYAGCTHCPLEIKNYRLCKHDILGKYGDEEIEVDSSEEKN